MRLQNYTLIFGIGNPGKDFENTYHNAGMRAVAHFAHSLGANIRASKRSKFFSYVKTDNDIVLARSLVFMNESGRAIREAMQKFQISPARILVVHDDSDISIGNFKISFNRGAAGHKGIESIAQFLKTSSFSRLRIGIRKLENLGKPREKARELVLRKISKENQALLDRVFDKAFQEIFPSRDSN